MVFNSATVGRVARTSADLCQYIACNPERLSTDQVLDLLCYLPFYHLRRLAACIFSFFCFPINTPFDSFNYNTSNTYYRYSSSSSSSSDSDSDDVAFGNYDSHSD